ncbi:MAG: type II secretion system F family protein [Gammaproteobacteria bacterium]|nr:type II secretion system F family protein [Gammaproteobacteria bacterium]
MASFWFKAVNGEGVTEEGEMDAANQAALIAQLQDAGYVPIQVSPAKGATRRGPLLPSLNLSRKAVSARDVGLFTRELATLLHAGMPLDESLKTLIEVADSDSVKGLVTAIHDRVRDGADFSAALEAQNGTFSNLYISMVRAGESAGALDTTLARLADYMKRQKDLRDSVLSAVTYPVILVVVAAVSMILLLVFVIPQFAQMFDDMGAELPLPTQIVMGAGDLLRQYWWMLPALPVVIAILAKSLLANPKRLLKWHNFLLRAPLVGELLTKLEVARITRTLGVMLENGVPLLRAVRIMEGSISNRALAQDMLDTADELQAGRGLAASLAAGDRIPKLAIKMIRVGEDSGQLDEMLLRLADVYDQETKTTVQRVLGLLEPILIVGLGVLIAGIIFSILIAVLGMNQLLI